jgi:hypothetical protein
LCWLDAVVVDQEIMRRAGWRCMKAVPHDIDLDEDHRAGCLD